MDKHQIKHSYVLRSHTHSWLALQKRFPCNNYIFSCQPQNDCFVLSDLMMSSMHFKWFPRPKRAFSLFHSNDARVADEWTVRAHCSILLLRLLLVVPCTTPLTLFSHQTPALREIATSAGATVTCLVINQQRRAERTAIAAAA